MSSAVTRPAGPTTTSSAATSPAGFPLWGARRGSWFLVGVHAVFVATPPALTLAAGEHSSAQTVAIVLLSLAIGGLQLRHSIAASRGRHPAGWRWTVLALAALTYLPLLWFAGDAPLQWSIHGLYVAALAAFEEAAATQWAMHGLFLAASAAMLMRARPARWVIAGVIVPPIVFTGVLAGIESGSRITLVAMGVTYQLAVFVVFPATLHWSVRLVRTVDELFAVRTALAESAVVEERRRISRDLHDLLGQSLSAISLKGDLAMRLWPSDRQAALAEIDSLTGVARDALHDVRGVTQTAHEVSLGTEIDQASALLAAASIEVHANLDLPALSAPVDHLLAWALREGATNMLRHSEAGNCWITAGMQDETVWLEIVNDGARVQTNHGSGLSGLAERAQVLSGSVSADHMRAGRFRLLVEAPHAATASEWKSSRASAASASTSARWWASR